MINIQSGVLDKTRLVSNLLMLVLLIGNIFFSIQYTENMKQQALDEGSKSAQTEERLKTAQFLKYFIDTALNTQGTISFDDRVKLENDVRQLHDPAITAQWNELVNNKDVKASQANAVKLMLLLTNKLI
ncbi:MAG: hypothetical protein RIT04_414 [Candidatus Parcubacteria bacterium]|jgi:predicted component of type VI protein secretion system